MTDIYTGGILVLLQLLLLLQPLLFPGHQSLHVGDIDRLGTDQITAALVCHIMADMFP